MNTAKFFVVTSVIVVWAGHFLVDMMIGIWPIYKTIAHLDLAIAGIISGTCAFFGEGLQVLFGSLSDRGYRKHLMLGGVVAAAASVFFAYVDNYLLFFAFYLLTCIGSGAFHPSAASLIGDLSSERRGALMAIYTSGGALGMAFSQIIFIYSYVFWNGHVVLLALPALLLMFFVAFSSIGRRSSDGPSPHHFNPKEIVKFFRQRELCLLYFTQLCNAAMLWGVMFLLPDILSTRNYETWVAFGGGHLAFILGGAVMMVPAGYLADRYSSRAVILVATVLGMILFYLFLFIPFMSNYVLLTLLFWMGAAIAVVNPVVLALGIHLMPNHKGTVSAFLMGMVWCVSEGIGQAGGGLLTKFFVDDAPAKALAVLGCLFLVGMIFAFQLPKKEEALEFAPHVE